MLNIYLGAGEDRKEGYVHLDAVAFDGIDKVWKCPENLPFAANSVDKVFTQDFLEHIRPEDKVPLMNEIWRVLKVGGVMEHWIPNAGSRNDFGSPSHLSHWNLQQFQHFDKYSYRWAKDRKYEGFIGAFKEILAEEVNPIQEYGRDIPQAIHVIYQKENVE